MPCRPASLLRTQQHIQHTEFWSRRMQHHVHPTSQTGILKRIHKGVHTDRQIQYNEENPHCQVIEINQIELENKGHTMTDHVEWMDGPRPEKAQMTHTDLCNTILLALCIDNIKTLSFSLYPTLYKLSAVQ